MPTMNIVLTERQEALMARLVESGQYLDESEVVREALHVLEAMEADEAVKLAVLRREIQVGLDAIQRGEYKVFDDTRELRRYLKALMDQAIAGAAEE